MKRIFVICAAVVLAATACEKNSTEAEAVKTESKVPVQVFADMPVLESADTKVNFVNPAGDDFSLKWEVGDTIYVYNKKADYTIDASVTPKTITMNSFNRVAYEVTAVDALTGRATFKAEDGVDPDTVFDSESDTFYASMGGEPNATWHSNFLYEENVIQSILPANIIALPAGRLDKRSFIAVSKAKLSGDGTLTFKFHPVLGYFRITIPENCVAEVGSIRFYPYTGTPKSPNLSGFYQITLDESGSFASGVRANGVTAGGSANIVFYHREAGETENTMFPAGTYYFPMLPDISIRAIRCYSNLTANSEKFINATGLSFAAERGKVKDLGTLPTATE